MNLSIGSFQQLLQRARAGDRDALGELLQHHRAFLKLITQRTLGPRLGGRLDDSDIIQQTCMSVFGNIKQFGGDQPNEFVAWIRTIHERNVKNAVRDHVGAQKRSITKEEVWDDVPPEGTLPKDRKSSPSQRVLRGEQAVRLAAALQGLADDQREAVRLRYLEGWSLEQIAEHMDRSKHSVAGLVKRGLIKLRQVFKNESQV